MKTEKGNPRPVRFDKADELELTKFCERTSIPFSGLVRLSVRYYLSVCRCIGGAPPPFTQTSLIDYLKEVDRRSTSLALGAEIDLKKICGGKISLKDFARPANGEAVKG